MKKLLSIICAITGIFTVFFVPNDDASLSAMLIWLAVGLASLYGFNWARKETK